jgi:hypothetical protein
MATWGVVLATGFVTIMAAMLPMLVESKADKARRAEERAERRRDEKKAAFAAYLVAANELTGSSFDQGSGGERTARGHAAVQGLVTAAMAAELVSVGPELRRELGATFGLVGAPFGETPGFGEHLQTIRALMTAELAEDQRIVKEHAGRHAARTGFLDRRTRRTDPSALRAHNQALPWERYTRAVKASLCRGGLPRFRNLPRGERPSGAVRAVVSSGSTLAKPVVRLINALTPFGGSEHHVPRRHTEHDAAAAAGTGRAAPHPR